MIHHYINRGYVWHYYLLRPWEYVRDYYRELRCIVTRGLKGWCKEDVWELNYYLATVMRDTILHLKNHHNVYPSALTDKTWNKELLLMSKRFNKYLKLDDIGLDGKKFYWAKYKKEFDEFNKVWKQLETHFRSLWD